MLTWRRISFFLVALFKCYQVKLKRWNGEKEHSGGASHCHTTTQLMLIPQKPKDQVSRWVSGFTSSHKRLGGATAKIELNQTMGYSIPQHDRMTAVQGKGQFRQVWVFQVRSCGGAGSGRWVRLWWSVTGFILYFITIVVSPFFPPPSPFVLFC